MRASDHNTPRTLIATVGTIPLSLLSGPVFARVLPSFGGWSLGIGWQLPYLVWPVAVLLALCATSWQRAFAGVAASTAMLGLLALV